MRDTELFAQYLIRRRQEKLQQAHALALSPEADLLRIRVAAHEAELIGSILGDLKALEKDPGAFIREKLSDWKDLLDT